MNYALLKDKSVLIFASTTVLLSLFSLVCLSVFMGLTILLSLTAGLLAPLIIFSDKGPLPNFLHLFTGHSKSCPQKQIPRSCSICGGEQCNRQHTNSSSNISAHAHIYFTVPQSVDEALEEILNLVLDHHIYNWYKEISIHDQLADEIRFIIRYAAAAVGSRLTKVDLTTIILQRLIPSGLSHLDAFMEGSRRVRGNASVESSVMQYLSSRNTLHAAMISREDEANYLRGIVCSLIPYLIPKQYQESKIAKTFLQELLGRFLILQGMDLLADPDIVNFLFLLLFDDFDKATSGPAHPEPSVLLLKSFASVNTHPRNSSLRGNLSTVLKDQSLLYLFHSYLKIEGAINILSFCLAVEDFNRHILDPDLTSEQLQTLHKEALEFYHTYMVPTAVDKLHFQPEIVSHIKEIVHSEVNDIVKLRTTRPLFQAYEYAYNLLEREYLPLFMSSSAYFSHICGSKHQQTVHRSSNRDIDSASFSTNLGTRVGKGVAQRVGSGLASLGRQMTLKPYVINGEDDVLSDVDEGSDVSTYMTEEGGLARNALEGLSHAFRDLSAWRVSIPRVEERIDATGKMEFVFIADVTRIDVSGDNPEELHWEVERRYNEFYVLEAKLTEFHGDFPDNYLPPRRSFFSSKGTSFMHSRRQIFQDFLQKLLQNPALKNSQLLFLFFKSKDEFTASYLPDVSLGRLLKEVPRKLIKERGQNLDSFISNFISSTSYKSINNSNSSSDFEGSLYTDEPKYLFTLPSGDPTIKEGIYKDNAQSISTMTINLPATPSLPPMYINGVVESVLYVAIRLYGLSSTCLRWAMCFKVLLGNTIDAAVAWFLRKKLTESFQSPKLVKLIHIIRDALFFDPPSPRSPMDRLARERDIRDKVITLIPKWTRKLVFVPDFYYEGANTLVNLFQYPVLNKQLSYVLLDIILEELFPELMGDKDSNSHFLRFLSQSNSVIT